VRLGEDGEHRHALGLELVRERPDDVSAVLLADLRQPSQQPALVVEQFDIGLGDVDDNVAKGHGRKTSRYSWMRGATRERFFWTAKRRLIPVRMPSVTQMSCIE